LNNKHFVKLRRLTAFLEAASFAFVVELFGNKTLLLIEELSHDPWL
jgi:hypothetical protein